MFWRRYLPYIAIVVLIWMIRIAIIDSVIERGPETALRLARLTADLLVFDLLSDCGFFGWYSEYADGSLLLPAVRGMVDCRRLLQNTRCKRAMVMEFCLSAILWAPIFDGFKKLCRRDSNGQL